MFNIYKSFCISVLSCGISKKLILSILVTDDLKNLVLKLENRVSQLEKGSTGTKPAAAPAAKPAPAKVEEEDDDDDVDLFGSDSEDEEAKAEKVSNTSHLDLDYFGYNCRIWS